MKTHESKPLPGVGVVIIRDGCLLLIKRGRGANAGLWAVPGGKVEFGETRRAAAAREAREETGLEVSVGDVAWIGEAIGPGEPPEWHFTLVDFFATPIGGEVLAGDDADDIDWVPIESVLERPVTPTMVDLIEKLRTTRPG